MDGLVIVDTVLLKIWKDGKTCKEVCTDLGVTITKGQIGDIVTIFVWYYPHTNKTFGETQVSHTYKRRKNQWHTSLERLLKHL